MEKSVTAFINKLTRFFFSMCRIWHIMHLRVKSKSTKCDASIYLFAIVQIYSMRKSICTINLKQAHGSTFKANKSVMNKH